MLAITYVSCSCCCSVTKLYPTLQPRGLWPTRLLCPWDFQARMLEWDAISFSGGSSWTRDWYMSPVFAGRFFTTTPPGKPTHVSVCVCVTQSCLTLCDSMDCSPPGSSVHGILQAWIPEWAVISFSRGSSQPRDGTQASCTEAGAILSALLPLMSVAYS